MTGTQIFAGGSLRRRWLALAAPLLFVVAGLAACGTSTVKTIVPPTPTTGSILVAVDRTHYTVSQAIGVTVSNTATKTDYYAKTGASACTYIQLEKYDISKNVWVAVDGCQTGDAPHVLQIQRASTIPYTLAPYSPANQNQWDPGTYRVALSYSTDANVRSGVVTAYSAGFTIS